MTQHAVLGQVLVGLRAVVDVTLPHALIVDVEDVTLFHTVLLAAHGAGACVMELDGRGTFPTALVEQRTHRKSNHTGGARRKRRGVDDNYERCVELFARYPQLELDF